MLNKCSAREIEALCYVIKQFIISNFCALRAVLGDHQSSYEVLLQTSGCKRIHEIHIFHLLCEVYKTLHNLNPSFMQTLFKVKSIHYSLRNRNLLWIPAAKSQHFGTQSFLFRGSLLWNSLPDSVKSQNSLETFKRLLKILNLQSICTCRICKIWKFEYYHCWYKLVIVLYLYYVKPTLNKLENKINKNKIITFDSLN